MEYGLGGFGDARLSKGGAELLAALVARPGSCIRQLAQRNRASEVKFTRFLRNGAVMVDEMVAHAGERTAARAIGRHVVVAQDTSEISVGGRRAKENGYGPIGKGGALRGLLLHAALAVDVSKGSRGVLGLVDAKVWNRTGGEKVKDRRLREMKDKESQRWLDSTLRAGEVLTQAASVTVVSDRESDIFEYFVSRPEKIDLIVRAFQNRRIQGDDQEDLLFAHVDRLAEEGRIEVNIPAAPGRKARRSELAVRFLPKVSLCKPLNGAADLPDTVTLTMVDVHETSKPDDSDPIHWRLLTTHPVTTITDACRVIDLYRTRWTIEEYFHTLKTGGFDIEAADISDPKVLMKFIAAVAVAGVSVMQLVKARDGTTGQSLVEVFDPADQSIIEALSIKLEGKTDRQKNPHTKGSLAFAAWVMARLGGWNCYYGKPGPKTMRLGMEAFHHIRFGATLGMEFGVAPGIENV